MLGELLLRFTVNTDKPSSPDSVNADVGKQNNCAIFFITDGNKAVPLLKYKEVFLCPIFLQSPSRMNGERLIS